MPGRTAMVHSSDASTMKAWEQFVTGKSVSADGVGAPVVASWQRSADFKIKPESCEAPLIVSGDAFEALRWRHRELLKAASGIFAATKAALAASHSIMILTSAEGVVLDAAGSTETLDKGQDIHLMPGGDWREQAIGTNGIGMALACGGPAQCHAAEHFCAGIKGWTCAAAPVREPGSGRVLGVLDISGPPQTYQRHNLAFAVAAARQIEFVLESQWSAERIKLLEACLSHISLSDAAGLLAIDRRGHLVHRAGRVPLESRVGEPLPGLDAGPVESWARRLPAGLRAEWLTPVAVDGETIGAMLVIPESPGRTRSRLPDQSSEADPGRSAFAHIEGASPSLQAVISRARRLVGRRVPVLIDGETGAGKELFARALHGEENRGAPFITFNCAATSKDLIGDELFGHVRGAYTGATSEGRAGRFELAHGGTLCLDEIGDMPLSLQPVLLRALEEGVIYRLGDTQPRRVEVRLLALTNRDLQEEIAAGRFRRDLYHRISVTRLRIPPLRERADDVPGLVEHFNRQLAQRHGLPEKRFAPEALAALRAYWWPGNIRELRNLVESLVLMCDGGAVGLADLPPEVARGAVPPGPAPAVVPDAASLDDVEYIAVRRALQSSQGNLTQAARALGIARSTLYRKVHRYRLESLLGPAEDWDHPG